MKKFSMGLLAALMFMANLASAWNVYPEYFPGYYNGYLAAPYLYGDSINVGRPYLEWWRGNNDPNGRFDWHYISTFDYHLDHYPFRHGMYSIFPPKPVREPKEESGCPMGNINTPSCGQQMQSLPSQQQMPSVQMGNQNQMNNQNNAGAIENQFENLIVMFTTEGCPFCDYMKPIMKKAKKEFGKDIKFLFLDTKANPELAAKYGFSTVPHIIYFKSGRQMQAHGSENKTMTLEQVEKLIKDLYKL